MRAKVVKGFGSGSVWLCQDGSSEQGLRIDQKDGAPIFPELVGQHFCFVSWEKEQPIFRGGPGYGSIPGYRGGEPYSRSVWRRVVFGKFSSVSWIDVPMISWAIPVVSQRRTEAELKDLEGKTFASLFQRYASSLLRFDNDLNFLYLGDDSCAAAIEDMVADKGLVYIEPHVWADIFLAMPDQSFPIPDLVQKELVDRLKKTALECSSLKGKSARLAAEKAATDAQIRELEERMVELALRGAT